MNAKIQQAFAHHQRGELAQAETLYREVLALAPGHSGVLHMLGLVQHQLHRPEEAAELIRAAIAIDPAQAAAHANLALVLQVLRDYDGALASCDRALARQPHYPEALNNRGNALHCLGRDDEALASYDRALALKPDYAEAHNNRGATLAALGRYADALASCDRALALRRDYLDALGNRGDALRGLGRDQEALASYDRALALDPGRVEVLVHRGMVLRNLGRADEALASYERALAGMPRHAVALNNRGNALFALNRLDEALASYDRALDVAPGSIEVLNNRVRVLVAQGRLRDALATCNQVLALDPRCAEALARRGDALYALKRFDEAAEGYARLLAVAADYDYAAGALLRCRLMCCDWADLPALARNVESAVERGVRATSPFAFLVHSRSPGAQLRCARMYVADRFPPEQRSLSRAPRPPHERIRVAYLSSNFHEHAVAYLAAGLFEAHDRQRFEITGVSFGPAAKGGIRERLERAFDRFVDVTGDSDLEVAQMLAAQEIDIAVDLTGHTADSRTGILAYRPAPLQVNFLGYPGTLGAEYIDYIIADRFVIPEGENAFYSERVVRLPDSYQVNDDKRRIAAGTPTRAEAGLPDAAFVFCCFNNNFKITPEIFAIWMRLVERVEGSVLWLLEDTATAAANLRREAVRRGVREERLVFAPRRPQEEHLARQRLADLFVDTLPYNAHTTASDALWAGLPVVTCMGETFAGRVAGSLLHAAGLPELATRSLDEYEALALRLATTPPLLAAIRARLAGNRATCPQFDTDRFRRHIESAYTTMHERHVAGLPPASFTVDAIP